MNFVRYIIPCFIMFLFGCNREAEKLLVHVTINQAVGRKVYLQKVPIKDSEKIVVDSSVISSKKNTAVFSFPNEEERVYRLTVSDSRLEIYFVSDEPVINIESDLKNPQNYSINTPANTSLKNFFDHQNTLAGQAKEIFFKIDSLHRPGVMPGALDSLRRRLTATQFNMNSQYKNFADTVSSAGAFLLVYNAINFDSDLRGLKIFILAAAKRFPGHTAVQRLKTETLAYLKNLEEPYIVGNKMPELDLTGIDGTKFSTIKLRTKYYLVDFWASWCAECLLAIPQKKQASDFLKSKKGELISIAIDSEKESCKQIISMNKMNWPQFIDQKMWQGAVVAKTKIDRIPFNFLVNPEGIIIRKAIPADSLVYYVKLYIK